jgi:hypothetical protein
MGPAGGGMEAYARDPPEGAKVEAYKITVHSAWKC